MTLFSRHFPLPVILLMGSLGACISYEPRQLVPSITLSAENIELASRNTENTPGNGLDFGLVAGVNESDSLSNVAVLPGVRVRTVVPGGAAAAAGIRPGDVILAVDDLAINHPDELAAVALQYSQETLLQFQLRRDTAVLQAAVSASPAQNNTVAVEELYRADPIASRAAYRTELLRVDGQISQTGARIVEFFPESPLPGDDFRVNDVILATDDVNTGSAQGLVTRLNNDYQLGQRLDVTLLRDGEVLNKPMTLWDPGRRINRIGLRPLMYYESSLEPRRSTFSILDFWLFSIYRFTRDDGERRHQFLEIFSVSSDYGELLEETN